MTPRTLNDASPSQRKWPSGVMTISISLGVVQFSPNMQPRIA